MHYAGLVFGVISFIRWPKKHFSFLLVDQENGSVVVMSDTFGLHNILFGSLVRDLVWARLGNKGGSLKKRR